MLSFSFQIYFQRQETQKKQQIFRIKLRKDRFRMFGPHSKPISTVPTWFKADFSLFRSVSAASWYKPIWPIQLDSGRICLVQHKSAQIEAKFARIEAELARIRKKKKQQKKIRCSTDARVAASVAAPRVGLRCDTLPTASMFPRWAISAPHHMLFWP